MTIRIPDDPAKAQAWLSGVGTPELELDLYVPRGNKGDPGGIVAGTDLGAANLDEIRTAGVYRNVTAAGTLLLNYPVPQAGVLLVLERQTPGNSVIQEFRPITTSTGNNSRVFYQRTYQGAVWSPWRAFTSQRVDQTAGRAIYAWDDLNGREQLIYGDTGVRDITGLRNTANVSSGVIEIRRQHYQVTIHFRGVTVLAAGAIELVAASQLPNFEPATSSTDIRGLLITAAGEPRMLEVSTAGRLQLYAATSGGTYSGSITYVTARAWPTVLPGAAVGTIPNT